MTADRDPLHETRRARIDDRDATLIGHQDLFGGGVVPNVVGIPTDIDGPARLQCGRIHELQGPGVAVCNGHRAKIGKNGDALRLVKSRKRSHNHVLIGIDDFYRVISKRGNKETPPLGIERQMIDTSADIRQRDCRDRFQRGSLGLQLAVDQRNSQRAQCNDGNAELHVTR
jgi:hypothetical protein